MDRTAGYPRFSSPRVGQRPITPRVGPTNFHYCETAAAAFSPNSLPLAKRLGEKGSISVAALPVAIVSAKHLPAIGPALKPQVPQPTSIKKLSSSPAAPMIGA